MNVIKSLLVVLLIVGVGTSTMAQQQAGELEYLNGSKINPENIVKLYPNPTYTDHIEVKIEHSTLENVVISLYNIIGNKIEVEVENNIDNIYRIKLDDLPQGYYLLSIQDDGKKFKETYKFLRR